jgi:GT2 family glycosyltransferase
VTAVLVSHDGARWLADSLAALAAQTRSPQRVVAVDTGSLDDSPRLLAETLGDSAVVHLPRDTSLADAVQAGLDAFQGSPAPPGSRGSVTEWIWLLHDDCAPEPRALRELLAQAVASPSLAALGPKVVSWDSRRLQEIGLTVDSSGRSQTRLEPREVDQGQHDDVGDVLAVGTAGLLVRRDVWNALGGFDGAWPVLGEDVDFGWRLNAAGERMGLAPRAVVRHVGALQHGLRAADAAPGRPAAVARRHGLQVVLANTATALVPLLAIRYVLEALGRSLGLLLTRQPVAALDEVVGTAGALARPGQIVAARRRRRGRTVRHGDLRPLLAPPSLRLRRFGDVLAETFGGRRAAEQRRQRRAPVETGPVSEETEALDLGDTGWLWRTLRRPGVVLALALTAVGLIASRGVLGGMLHGGRLLPAPGGAGDLWSTYRATWHPVGVGSMTPAPPALAAFALLSTVLLGKAWLAVDLLILGAVPLAGLAAYAATGAVTRSRAQRVWAAVTYAVLPAVTGAVAGGRLDVVAALILLPLAARAIAGALLAGGRTPYRWVGAGLLLALVVAFAPVVWPLAVVALAGALALFPGRRQRVSAVAVILGVPLAALMPWTGTVALHPRLLFAGSGLPETLTSRRPLPATDLLLMHPGGPAQPPWWVLGPVVVAALIGLARRRGARLARVGFLVFAVAVAGAIVETRVGGAGADPTVRFWTGVPLGLAALGVLTGALVAADRARGALRRHSFTWRQPAAALLAAAAIAGTGICVVAWSVRGADRPLTDSSAQLLPVFAAAEVARSTAPRIVVMRPDGAVIRYTLVRDPAGPRLGDADVLASTSRSTADRRLAAAVQAASAGQADAVAALAGFGVSMIVVPGADPTAVRGLADVDGLDQVPATGAVVWRSRIATGEVVVLPPGAAARVTGGAERSSAGSASPLRARPGRARTTVPAGPAGRLLVLAEPVSSHWAARVDGHRLAPTRAYGWAQAWRLPAAGGRLEIGRTGDYRGIWLVAELVAVGVLMLLALPVRRRDDASEEAS